MYLIDSINQAYQGSAMKYKQNPLPQITFCFVSGQEVESRGSSKMQMLMGNAFRVRIATGELDLKLFPH